MPAPTAHPKIRRGVLGGHLISKGRRAGAAPGRTPIVRPGRFACRARPAMLAVASENRLAGAQAGGAYFSPSIDLAQARSLSGWKSPAEMPILKEYHFRNTGSARAIRLHAPPLAASLAPSRRNTRPC
jgi:hypothetical protein